MNLIKYDSDWADEMAISGFSILTDKAWKKIRNYIKEANYPYEYYVGSNEFIAYESSEEFLMDFTTVSISNEEANSIRDLFSLSDNYPNSYGHFPDFD